MEVKAEGMGREMSEKRIESTGRREGLEGRRRKGIYSQQRHVRLHEKELFIQEPRFSHEFPKTQASACVPLLFPPHSLGSPCSPTHLPLHPPDPCLLTSRPTLPAQQCRLPLHLSHSALTAPYQDYSHPLKWETLRCCNVWLELNLKLF